MDKQLIKHYSAFFIGEGNLLINCVKIFLDKGFEVLGVISNDKKVHYWCNSHQINLILDHNNIEPAFKSCSFDFLFSIVNNYILSNEILTLPRVAAINYHDSLLPKYAGIHATTWALYNQESTHGVSWHKIKNKIDSGEIYKQKTIRINSDETAFTLNGKCYELALESFKELLIDIESGQLKTEPQDLQLRSYFGRHTKPSPCGLISFSENSSKISALVRSLYFDMYPNNITSPKIILNKIPFIVGNVSITNNKSQLSPGEIVSITGDYIEVATADNNIHINKLFNLDSSLVNFDTLSTISKKCTALTPASLTQLASIEKEIVKHEYYWLKQIQDLDQVYFSFINTNSALESCYESINMDLSAEFLTLSNLSELSLDEFLSISTILFISKLSNLIEFSIAYSDIQVKEFVKQYDNFFATNLPLNLKIDPSRSTIYNFEIIQQQIKLNKNAKSFAKDIFYRHKDLQSKNIKYNFGIRITNKNYSNYIYQDNFITFTLNPDDKKVGLIYDKNSINSQAVQKIQKHYSNFINSFCNNLELPFYKLSLLDKTENNMVLYGWNDTYKDYPTNKLIHQLFEDQVAMSPDNDALQFQNESMTYKELDNKATKLANCLINNSMASDTKRVGVLMERSFDMIISLLGILKAGYAYVPIDPEYPKSRIDFIIEDSSLKIILTQSEFKNIITIDTINIFTLEEYINLENININKLTGITLNDVAYIIYTSGSTGRPKGVMIPHKGILNRLLWMQDEFKLNHADVVLQKTPYTFDVSVWEIFWPLMFGAKLVIANPGGQRDSQYIAEIIHKEHISVLHFVPSMLKMFIDSNKLLSDKCASLRAIICSGEELSISTVNQAYSELRNPKFDIYNLYGPTEASIDVTYYKCNRNSELNFVPIGTPIANTQMYILDKYMQPVPPGVPGILYIGGIGLANGYINRNDLNNEKFVKNPFNNHGNHKLYNTGDLAMFLEDGNINFLGRIDNQVKVHGLRIELGEIEVVLKQLPNIKDAIVIVRNDDNNIRIVGYLIFNGPQYTFNELRNHLQKKLPEYMIPTAFVFVDNLPITHNGKLDYKALPEPSLSRPELKEDFVEPTNQIEQTICNIWSEVLGIQGIGIQDNFFELGGDSMKMLQIISKLSNNDISLSVQNFFENPTIYSISKVVSNLSIEDKITTQPFSLIHNELDKEKFTKDIIDAYPMSMLQKGMAFHYEYTPNSSFYQVVMTIKVQGVFDEDLFDESLQEIVLRHPTLRTVFDMVNFSEPMQLVYNHSKTILEIKDIREYSEQEQIDLVEDYIKFESVRYFEWNKTPPFRVAVLKLKDDLFQFFLSYLDLVLDGWSASSFMVELFNSYTDKLKLESNDGLHPPKVTYRDFVAYEQEAIVSEEHKSFWSNLLKEYDYTDIYKLPIKLNKPDLAKSDDYEVNFPVDIYEGIKALSKDISLPIKHIILACHIKMLSMLSGSDDVITGLVANGRLEFSDGEKCLGNHLNTIPFRVNLVNKNKDMSWIDLIKYIFSVEQDILPYRRYPNSYLQLGAHNAQLYDVAFNFTYFHSFNKYRGKDICNLLQGKLTNPFHYAYSATFRVNEWSMHNSAILDDTIRTERNIAIRNEKSNNLFSDFMVALNYNDSKISIEQIKQIGKLYIDIFRAILKKPSGSYLSSVINESTMKKILATAKNEVKSNSLYIQNIITDRSHQTPNNIALLFGDISYTYKELNTKSNQFARYLTELGAGVGSNVGVCLDRSLEMIISLLGILKAGCAYVPIDPDFPIDRKTFILDDANINILVTSTKYIPSGVISSKVHIVDVYADKALIDSTPCEFNNILVQEEDLAYIIYTSGSTGRPKGVMIPHKGLTNRLMWMQDEFKLNSTDAILQKTPYTFDVSVWEIFWPLMFGAKLVIAEPGGHKDNAYLQNTIFKYNITVLHFVPSMLKMFLEESKISDYNNSLKTVICSGEELPQNTASKFFNLFDDIVSLYNLYGPTEASIDVTYYKVTPENKYTIVPIGYPISNTQLYILDKNLQPVPAGIPGILYIGGIGLAKGYCNLPNLTKEKFIPNPFINDISQKIYNTGDLVCQLPDGELQFLGRIDNQVKVRGFRIELGEVENAIAKHKNVKFAIVQVRGNNEEHKKLVAYIVLNDKSMFDALEIRNFLSQSLPEYMIPGHFICMDNIPTTSNGKLDYKLLPNPEAHINNELNKISVAPRNDKERLLAKIFKNILNINNICVNDNFFILGGDSILAMQIAAKLRQNGIYITSKMIFQNPTISELAELAQYNQNCVINVGAVEGEIQMAPIQTKFFALQLTTINHWNASFAATVNEDVDIFIFKKALGIVFDHHDSFRIRFKQEHTNWIQYYSDSKNNYKFAYEDLSMLNTEEQINKREELATKYHASLNIVDGPLVYIVYFNFGGKNKDYILYIFHHLIIDGISIRVVIEDINAAYKQLKNKNIVRLPDKTTSFKSYTDHLLKYSQNQEIRDELIYWQNLPLEKVKQIPVDYEGGTLIELTSRNIILYLDEDETKKLISVPSLYKTKLVDILITALAISYKLTFNLDHLYLNLAHNGRDLNVETMDLSRSIGWFQILFPVLIPIPQFDYIELLKNISNEIKKVPNNGMGYNLLKFVNPDNSIKASMNRLPDPQISLNYLGQFNQNIDDYSMCKLTGEGFGMRHGSDCQISWDNILIRLFPIIINDKFKIAFNYSETSYKHETINKLATEFMKALRYIINLDNIHNYNSNMLLDVPNHQTPNTNNEVVLD